MPHRTNHLTSILQGNLSRRALLKYSMAGLAGLAFGNESRQILGAREAEPISSSTITPPITSPPHKMPLLFCIAYIDPDIPSQANQESLVAKYPLTIVPQDMRPSHAQWRDRIKQLNPKIVMLGYQMLIEETTVPGPGHDHMRKVKDAWSRYPGGYLPTVKVEPGPREFRIFDPRNPAWQESFLTACRATLRSYPYDGLFLDQCTVYDKAHPLPGVRTQMRQALQITLLRLRQEFPNTILIGNSSYNWQGLNGELNEGRPKQALEELAPFNGHVQPAIELYESFLKNPQDIERVKLEMALAHSQGAYYSACVDNQHILWFDVFDEVMARSR